MAGAQLVGLPRWVQRVADQHQPGRRPSPSRRERTDPATQGATAEKDRIRARLRHRFQTDVVGLDRSRHRLVGSGEDMRLEYDDHGLALPQVLGAVYAAGKLSYKARPEVFRLLRRATRWDSGNDDRMIGYLTGDEAARHSWRTSGYDEKWALELLGFRGDLEPARSEILKRFRKLLFSAHPDHGGNTEGAGQRISELTEAKRILLTEV